MVLLGYNELKMNSYFHNSYFDIIIYVFYMRAKFQRCNNGKWKLWSLKDDAQSALVSLEVLTPLAPFTNMV